MGGWEGGRAGSEGSGGRREAEGRVKHPFGLKEQCCTFSK